MNLVIQKKYIYILISLFFLLASCKQSSNTKSNIGGEELQTQHLKFDPELGQEYEFELYNDFVKTQSLSSGGQPKKDELLFYLNVRCDQKTDSTITFSANIKTIAVLDEENLYDVYFHSDSTKIMILQKGAFVNKQEEALLVGGDLLTKMLTKLHKFKEVTKIPFKIELSGLDLSVKLIGYDSIASVLNANTTEKNDIRISGYEKLINRKFSNIAFKRLMSHTFINKRSHNHNIMTELKWEKILSKDKFVYNIATKPTPFKTSYKVNFVSGYIEDLNVSYTGDYTIHKETGMTLLGDYIKTTSLKSDANITLEEYTSVTLIAPKLDTIVQELNPKNGLVVPIDQN